MNNENWTVQHLQSNHHGYPDWDTYCVRSERNICLATVGDVDRASAPDNKRNAHLMAASPKLLTQCKALERELAHWHGWQMATNPNYPKSDGAKQTQGVLDAARKVITDYGLAYDN